MTEEIGLQNTLLELILRSYSQRSNLLDHLQAVNLFSTPEEIQIFNYFSNVIVEFRVIIQDSDTFIEPTGGEKPRLLPSTPMVRLAASPGGSITDEERKTRQVQSFRMKLNFLIVGMLHGTKVTNRTKVLFDAKDSTLRLSSSRQSMLSNLRVHEVFISFLHKKLPVLEAIVESKSSEAYKREVLLLFREVYTFLIFFCKDHSENQKTLYQKLDLLVGGMSLDLGQADLLCAVRPADQIYQANDWVLGDLRNNPALLEQLVRYIEREGRQVRFLKLFDVIIDSPPEFLLDNLYTVIRFLLPKYDPLENAWSNLKPMYMKATAEGRLEFELDLLPDIDSGEDTLELAVAKEPGEATYREEPFHYHAFVVKVVKPHQILKAIIEKSKNIYFFTNKIRELFSIPYALTLMTAEDGFIMAAIHKKSSDGFSLKKSNLRMSSAYLKLHIVDLFATLYFNKTYLNTLRLEDFSESLKFLIEFEAYRFKVMNFQTDFLSYKPLFEKFDRNRELFHTFLEHLLIAKSGLFEECMKDEDLKEDYGQMKAQGSLR